MDYRKQYSRWFPFETRRDFEDWKDTTDDEGVRYVSIDIVRDEYKRGRLVGFAIGAFCMLVLCVILGLLV